MSKVTITFEDNGSEVDVNVDFGEEGTNDHSGAHHMAIKAMDLLIKSQKKRDYDDDYE